MNNYHECCELSLQIVRRFLLLEVILLAHTLQGLGGLEPGYGCVVRWLGRRNLTISNI